MKDAFRNYITWVLTFWVSISLILACEAKWAVTLGSAGVTCAILHHLYKRIIRPFKKNSILNDLSSGVDLISVAIINSHDAKKLKTINANVGGEDVSDKIRLSVMMPIYALYQIGMHWANRIRRIYESRKTDAYLVASVIFTFIFTVFSFGALYMGLMKINASYFSPPKPTHNLLDFIEFSLSVITSSSVSDIRASHGFAKLAANTEIFAGFVVLILLITIVFTSNRDLFRRDAERLSNSFKAASDRANLFMIESLSIEMVQAERELCDEKSGHHKIAIFVKKLNSRPSDVDT
jgi:hypothetical protein